MKIKQKLLLNIVFELICNPLSVHDRLFRIVKVNNAMAKFLDCKPSDIIGEKCYKVFHNRNMPWPTCPYLETIKTGELSEEVITDPHWGMQLNISCFPILDQTGGMQGIVHMVRNIKMEKLSNNGNHHCKCPESALDSFRHMKGYLVICASCGYIQDENKNWMSFYRYFVENSGIMFSHGLCPDCYREIVKTIDI